jgi:hypothetical protein
MFGKHCRLSLKTAMDRTQTGGAGTKFNLVSDSCLAVGFAVGAWDCK